MSNLQQIQLNYDSVQDRLVLIFCTQDFAEYRFWITRRVLKALWSILQRLRQDLSSDLSQQREEDQKASSMIQKEKQQPQTSKYATKITHYPLGETPLLLYKIMAKPIDQGHILLHLEDNEGKSIEFGGDATLVNVLCQLIYKTSAQTEWDLVLTTQEI